MLAWINAVLPGYAISNFTTDWNDGLALQWDTNFICLCRSRPVVFQGILTAQVKLTHEVSKKERKLMRRSFNSHNAPAPRSQHPNKNVFSSRLNRWKLTSACRSSAGRLKAVPQLRTCSCKAPVSIVAVGSSHSTRPWCGRTQLMTTFVKGLSSPVS